MFTTLSNSVHACVYDPATGELKKLRVNLAGILDEYADVYNLYAHPGTKPLAGFGDFSEEEPVSSVGDLTSSEVFSEEDSNKVYMASEEEDVVLTGDQKAVTVG